MLVFIVCYSWGIWNSTRSCYWTHSKKNFLYSIEQQNSVFQPPQDILIYFFFRDKLTKKDFFFNPHTSDSQMQSNPSGNWMIVWSRSGVKLIIAWARPSLCLDTNRYSLLKVWMIKTSFTLSVFTPSSINAVRSSFLFVCFKCTSSESAEIAPQRLGTIYELGQHFSSNVAWLFTVSSQSRDWFSL